MATQVASLYGLLALDDRDFVRGMDAAEGKFDSVSGRMDKFGARVSGLGVELAAITKPLMDFGMQSLDVSLEFGKNMTNAQAAAGYTKEEITALSKEIDILGRYSTSGPLKATEAFYDIAGGIADASVRMDVLQTALDVTTAGAADLTGVTDSLITTMNIYGFSAEEAAHAGDVLTRTVGMGKGTMDEFGAALPPVAGLAKELGLTFDETGAYMAYMSTKSASVATGGTQLRGIFSKLLNPSEDLADAIEALGYTSGQALIEQRGLIGGLNLIKDYGGGTFAGLITDQEALLGAIALTTQGTDEFLKTYTDGIEGATAAAKAIQEQDPTAQLALLNAIVESLKKNIGDALVPALLDVATAFIPIVDGVIQWIGQNPELTAQILAVVGGLTVLGPILMAVGTVISSVGTIVGVLGGAIGLLFSPIGIAIAAAVALGAAYLTNFGGVRDFVDQQVRPRLEQFFTFLGNVWEQVRPALENLFNWFVTTGLPAIRDFVVNQVLPKIQEFFNFLGDVWNVVSPALTDLFNWFVNTGLPAIRDFVVNQVLPQLQEFFNFIGDVWNVVSPALTELFNWFVTTGMPVIRDFIANQVQPALEKFFGVIEGAWALISPVLGDIYDWFVTSGLPGIRDFIDSVGVRINEFINTVAGIWTNIQQPLNQLRTGITGALQPIVDLINSLKAGFDSLTGMAGAARTTQQAVAGSGLTQDQLWQRTVGASGGNDLAARIAFAAMGGTSLPKRDSGGDGVAGQSYLIGTGAQPELFTPRSAGTFTPANQMPKGDTYQVMVYANDAAGGAAAGDAFTRKLKAEKRRMGY